MEQKCLQVREAQKHTAPFPGWGLEIEIKATGRLRECLIDWLGVWVLDFSLSLRKRKTIENQNIKKW